MVYLINKYSKQVIALVRFLFVMLLVVMLSGCGINSTKTNPVVEQAKGKPNVEALIPLDQGNIEKTKGLSLETAEKRLVFDGYLMTLRSAVWAKSQGEQIIPILESMLNKREEYKIQGRGVTGAFPFNAIWALAYIQSPRSLEVLEKYYASSRDDEARLAIDGYKLRQQSGSASCGILIFDTKLYSEPNERSSVITLVTKGQQVKILKARIENSEKNGRGGKGQIYDYVELLTTGTCGYIKRSGDDFSPFI